MKTEWLNEQNYMGYDIKNGDRVFIGGSYPGRLDLSVLIDVPSFDKITDAVQKNTTRLTQDKGMQTWLHQYAPNIDVYTFATMYSFDNALRRIYPDMSKNSTMRKYFYTPDKTPTLSSAFADGVCECAEISLLAQIVMQKMKIQSKYVCGEILQQHTEEFGNAHSYLLVKMPDGYYFYDAANPLENKGTYIPTIMRPNADVQQVANFVSSGTPSPISGQRHCSYVDSKNIFTNKHVFYSYGDGMNVYPNFIISRDFPFPPQQPDNTRR